MVVLPHPPLGLTTKIERILLVSSRLLPVCKNIFSGSFAPAVAAGVFGAEDCFLGTETLAVAGFGGFWAAAVGLSTDESV